MALSSSTFSGLGGAVSDIFAGIGAEQQGALKAKGLQIDAQGNIIKAQGDIAEGQEYTLAQQLAQQNEKYTEQSYAIKQTQLDRQIYQTIGGQQADVAGAGFAQSGSAGDLMRDSAAQGALTKSVLAQQGLITEAGYTEQAQSYGVMANAANTAAAEEYNIANETNQLATDTQNAANTAATGDFIGAAISGIGALASLHI